MSNASECLLLQQFFLAVLIIFNTHTLLCNFQWDLVCANAYKSDLVQSIFMTGLLIGNLVGGGLRTSAADVPLSLSTSSV